MKAPTPDYCLLLLAVITLAAVRATSAAASPATSSVQLGVCYSKKDGTVMPIAGICSSYVYCLRENAIVLPCPIGTGFSQTARGCVSSASTNCEQLATTGATTPTVDKLDTTRTACVDNEKRPGNQAACVGQPFGALVPYPSDCSKFLVCNCEYPTVMSCAPGTWFNIATGNCDWPQNVNCTDGGGGSSTITTPDPPTTLDPSTASTADPPTTRDPTTLSTADPPITRDPPTTLDPTTASDPRTTADPPVDTSTTGPCVPPVGISGNSCDNEDEGTVFRYPYNCNAYVNCTLGCPALNYCPPDKVFNALLMICDTPDTAHCVDEPLPTTTTEMSTTTERSTTTEMSTTTDMSTTTEMSTTTDMSTTTEMSTTLDMSTTLPPCQSPPDGTYDKLCANQESGSMHSYPENCAAYITCTASGAELCYCPPDKVFNALLDICDTPDTVECPDAPLPPGVNTTMCAEEPNHTLLPYDDDCAAYIECLEGQVVMRTCPAGWLFNAALSICDEADDVNCEQAPGTNTPTDSSTDSTTSAPPATTTPIYELCSDSMAGDTYPYTEDCTLYYYCWGNGTSTILSCPYNNWYNPYTGRCGPEVSPTACLDYTSSSSTTTAASTVNPEAVCEDQAAGVTYPLPSNCAQYKYCTGSGSYIVLNCPAKNYYNPLTGKCGPNVSPTACQEDTSSPTTTYSTEQSTVEITTTTLAPTTLPPTSPTGICGNYSDGEMVPYPGNCHKYIVCVYPAPIAFSCEGGLYFNEQAQKCDLPENTACGVTTVTPPAGGSTTVFPPDICVGAEAGTTFPYPQNCQLYLRCTGDGQYNYEICDAGQYYDPQTGSCGVDVAHDACYQTSTPSTPSTPTPAPPTGLCAAEPDGTKVPYPGNCTKYIVCETPIPVGFDCADGLEFSSALQECTTPEEANCSVGNTTTTTSTSTPTTESSVAPPVFPTCVGQPDGTLIPYPYNCSKYIVCEDPIPVGYDCPDGLEFNAQLLECVAPELANCSFIVTTADPIITTTTNATENSTTVNDNICADAPDYTTLPYPADCSQYIVCFNNLPTNLRCMPGSYFNLQTGKCSSLVSETACQELSTLDPPASTEIITTSEGTTVNPYQQNVCCGQRLGTVVAYPGDCTRYIVCEYPVPVVVVCAENTIYDEDLLVCAPSDNGQCGITTSQSVLIASSTPRIQRTSPAADESSSSSEAPSSVFSSSSLPFTEPDTSTSAYSTTTDLPIESSTYTTAITEASEYTTATTDDSSSTITASSSTDNPTLSTGTTDEDTTAFTTSSADSSAITTSSSTDNTNTETTDDDSTVFITDSTTTDNPTQTTVSPDDDTTEFTTTSVEFSTGTTSSSTKIPTQTTADDTTNLTTEFSPTTTPGSSSITESSGTNNPTQSTEVTDDTTAFTASTGDSSIVTTSTDDDTTEFTPSTAGSTVTLSSSTNNPTRTTEDGTTDLTTEFSPTTTADSSTITESSSTNNPTQTTTPIEDDTTEFTPITSGDPSTPTTSSISNNSTMQNTDDDMTSTIEFTTTTSVGSTVTLSSTNNPTSNDDTTSTDKPTQSTTIPDDETTEFTTTSADSTTVTTSDSTDNPTQTITPIEDDTTEFTTTTSEGSTTVATPSSTNNPTMQNTDDDMTSTIEFTTTTPTGTPSVTTSTSATDENTTDDITVFTTKTTEGSPVVTTPITTEVPTTEQPTTVTDQPTTLTTRTTASSTITTPPFNDASSSAKTAPTTVKPSTTTTKTTPTTTTSTTTTTTTISPANANACIGQKSGTQVVYYGDCTKYNFCFGGESVVLDCGNNWYFNPQKKQCVPPGAYNCPW